MALPSPFKRKDPAAALPLPPVDGAEVQQARTRARRRLMGAAVLLAAGVIAFPLLFETQPRPIPVDLPIEIPRKDAVAPLPAPARQARPAQGSSAPSAPSAADAVVDPAAAPASAAVAATGTAPLATNETHASAPGAPASESRSARFVVQVGAFAEPTAAREARQKVERLGLKTYTQVVDTDNGKRTRVRIGPFESRDEAARALARLKTANLPGAVLVL